MRAHQGLKRLPQAPKYFMLPITAIWLPGWLCSRASCGPCLVNCTQSIHTQVAIHSSGNVVLQKTLESLQ